MSPKATFAVQPIKRRKLYEDVVERLQAMMLSGKLAPGDVLPSERELTEMFQVGRTSVREALFALQRAGLVSLRNGERAYVTRPSADVLVGELGLTVKYMLATPQGVRELQQARAMLEMSLARHAARHATPEDVSRLKQALETNGRAIGDLNEFTRTDVAFHLVLAEMPRNTIFISLHTALAGWLAEQRLTSLRASGADLAAYEAHRNIYEAVAAHDADAAERHMQAHLASVESFYWNELGAPR